MVSIVANTSTAVNCEDLSFDDINRVLLSSVEAIPVLYGASSVEEKISDHVQNKIWTDYLPIHTLVF